MRTVRRLAGSMGVCAVVFLGVGTTIRIQEGIPDNALIYVFPSEKKWAPQAAFMDRGFRQALEDPKRVASAMGYLAEITPATYRDVKRGGKYDGFKAFPALLEGRGHVFLGWEGPLIMYWFPHKLRWNADGSWNW